MNRSPSSGTLLRTGPMTRTNKKARRHGDDLRAASRLVVEATDRVTGVVEDMHRTIAGGPDVLGRPLEGPARGLTRLVYGSIRGVTRAVGAGIDAVLAQLAPLLGESVPGPERVALVAALNGVIGDNPRADYAFYGLAVLDSITGHPQECLDNLGRAIELNATLR